MEYFQARCGQNDIIVNYLQVAHELNKPEAARKQLRDGLVTRATLDVVCVFVGQLARHIDVVSVFVRLDEPA